MSHGLPHWGGEHWVPLHNKEKALKNDIKTSPKQIQFISFFLQKKAIFLFRSYNKTEIRKSMVFGTIFLNRPYHFFATFFFNKNAHFFAKTSFFYKQMKLLKNVFLQKKGFF